jgi:UDP-N-acetylmuramoylalanine--D-glutamate ligase
MRLADLGGRRVVLWGFGREGRASLDVLSNLESAPASIAIATDAPPPEEEAAITGVEWAHGDAAQEALRAAGVVIRSPGISRYREDAVALRDAGVAMTTATDLWFAEHEDELVIGITGTKGKSTTSSLVAHLLRAAGRDSVLAGNIGVPLLGVTTATPPDVWVVELSSHQISDLTHSPRIGVLLNLYREHVDWHGSVEQYFADKLNLFGHRDDGLAVLNAADPITLEQVIPVTDKRWFNRADGFHVDGDVVRRGDQQVIDGGSLTLRGSHNLGNVCAALTAVECAGIDGLSVAASLRDFAPLRHRLEPINGRDGLSYVNDSIATIPEAAIAACEAMRPGPVVLLAGGFDREQEYAVLEDYLASAGHVVATICMPPSGIRLHEALRARGVVSELAADLESAVQWARDLAPPRAVILLSPAAPSYGLFRDFEARGDAFRQLVSG